MFCCSRALLLAGLCSLFSSAAAQASPPGSPQASAKADYSQEAAVIEEMATTISFDNDGLSTRQQTSRVHVQTDAGVQQWGLLNMAYQSALQTVDVDYVRVLKPDSRVVVTPPDNIQDLDSEITRAAPFYSDLREKHVAVKGLAKGDILEYQVHWHATKALTPGQFWFEYSFQPDQIVLDERLEVRVPAQRTVKVKGPPATQSIRTEDGSRIYTWTYSKLENTKGAESEKQKLDAARGRLPAPDVQISSFQTWDDVGRWYWDLQKDRVEPSAAVRAKAAELTKGLSDDAAKVRALYSFVSTQYRYIGIAFGIGRYQPHSADDVLGNNYGDCKDKQTLLASLLQASGITLYPALISSSHKLDPDVPSPAQFDHVIGYLPQASDKAALWLDTTPEVAPFGFLLAPLRDKPALVMLGDKSAQLITTPADPPFPSSQAFKIEGKLDNDGTLEAKVEDTIRGDVEIALRAAFRKIPQPQWKDLVQQLSYGLGFAGTVSDVSATSAEITVEPFHFSYSYSRKDYPDWTKRQLTVPGLPFFMPPLRDDAKDPVWLGPQQETVSDSRVELPKGYKPQLPSNVDLKYDFAEYHASYSQDNGVLIAERRLLVKMHEVPVSEFEDYRNFVKQLENDVNRYVQTSSAATPPPSSLQPSAMMLSLLAGVRSLPDSSSAEANSLEASARSSLQQMDRSTAVNTFNRIVEIDPKFTRAWVELGVTQMMFRQVDGALDAMRKAIDSDPNQLVTRKVYALMLTDLRRKDEALAAWRDTLKIAPEDTDANTRVGGLLLEQKRYAEAVPYLEAAVKGSDIAATRIALGMAYLRTGQTDKGSDILQRVLKEHPEPIMLNDIGYALADANVDLDLALQYTRQAVRGQEEESGNIDLDNLLPDDLSCTEKIGAFWDSLGWAHFRLGHLQQAEDYLYAAWLLTQDMAVGDHLGQVYEEEKKTEKAIHIYRLALSTSGGPTSVGDSDEIRHRLQQLTGEKADGKPPTGINVFRNDLGGELSKLRSAKLQRLVPGSASAEFFLLFSPGPRIEDVHFISGSEKLKSADDALSEAKFQVAFPEGSSAHILRRAIVSCSEVTGCEAVLLLPDTVHSVN